MLLLFAMVAVVFATLLLQLFIKMEKAALTSKHLTQLYKDFSSNKYMHN